MDLSYIVPAYNVGNNLVRCINSIYKQNLEPDSFEVIIINDGSTDNTEAIATQLVASGEYLNLKVISQQNQGVSIARNTGLKQAKGEYVWCIDSDDMLVPNSIREIISLCKELTPDIFFFELLIQNPNGTEYKSHRQPFPLKTVIKGADAIIRNFSPGSACSAFFKRIFLTQNKLNFYPGIYHEDVEFTYKAVALAETVVFTDYIPYIYLKRPNSRSTSTTAKELTNRLSDNAIIASHFFKLAQDSSLSNSTQLCCRIEQQARSIIVGTVYTLCHNSAYKSKSIQHDIIKRLRDMNLFPLKPPTNSLKHLALTTFLNLRFWNYGR